MVLAVTAGCGSPPGGRAATDAPAAAPEPNASIVDRDASAAVSAGPSGVTGGQGSSGDPTTDTTDVPGSAEEHAGTGVAAAPPLDPPLDDGLTGRSTAEPSPAAPGEGTPSVPPAAARGTTATAPTTIPPTTTAVPGGTGDALDAEVSELEALVEGFGDEVTALDDQIP